MGSVYPSAGVRQAATQIASRLVREAFGKWPVLESDFWQPFLATVFVQVWRRLLLLFASGSGDTATRHQQAGCDAARLAGVPPRRLAQLTKSRLTWLSVTNGYRLKLTSSYHQPGLGIPEWAWITGGAAIEAGDAVMIQ